MDIVKIFEALTKQGIPPGLLFLSIILMIGTSGQAKHNELVRKQIEQIHASQILQIDQSRRFEERMVDKLNKVDLRVSKLEVQNELWEIPFYEDKSGHLYIDRKK